jgi:poly(hydroxyalkanoate) depolymerase family esterase
MRHLSDTIRRLVRAGASAVPAGSSVPHRQGRLTALTDFGSNPGALAAKTYIPEGLPGGAPLICVLHGCTQSAEAYDTGAGWSRMADEHRFALLFPEQQRLNNANLCFNWFSSQDIRRDSGEAFSIRQMIEAVAVNHAIDRRRIFINGLSAGGAMSAALLASYPDVFAGGAVIAGLPYDCAASIPEAFDRMRGHGIPSERQLQTSLREATDYDGAWPAISVWHGTNDAIVAPSNADAVVAQWLEVHGAEARPSTVEKADGYTLSRWTGADGRPSIEQYLIAGMGHGTPIAAQSGVGEAGPFMLDVGISSTTKLLEAWKLTVPAKRSFAGLADLIVGTPTEAAKGWQPEPARSKKPEGLKDIIEHALRAAGLMK